MLLNKAVQPYLTNPEKICLLETMESTKKHPPCATVYLMSSITTDGSQPEFTFMFTPTLSYTAISSPTRDSETLEASWIFPPFLGYMLSDDQWLERTYHVNPDACDLGQFMVATNVISGCRDVVALFYENEIGIDVDDDYRIVVFDKSERILDAAPLKSHVTFVDGQDRPADQYLRFHFQRCLVVSVCGGDPTEDYHEQEIDLFMEELGVYDHTMDFSHPDWKTRLGREVYAALERQEEMNMEEDED